MDGCKSSTKETDRWIPGAHWPTSLTKSSSSTVSEWPCPKTQVILTSVHTCTHSLEQVNIHIQLQIYSQNVRLILRILSKIVRTEHRKVQKVLKWIFCSKISTENPSFPFCLMCLRHIWQLCPLTTPVISYEPPSRRIAVWIFWLGMNKQFFRWIKHDMDYKNNPQWSSAVLSQTLILELERWLSK